MSSFILEDGSSLSDFLISLENAEIEMYKKRYGLKDIINSCASYTHVAERLDILIGLIFLYRGAMDDQEVAAAIYSDWGLQLTETKIKSLAYKFKSRRLYNSMHNYWLLKNEVKFTNDQKLIIQYVPLLDINVVHNSFRPKFTEDNFVARKDFAQHTKICGDDFRLNELLLIKRFAYAYMISDMEIIENYVKLKGLKINDKDRNMFVFESQIKFATVVNQLSAQLKNTGLEKI